MKVIVYSNCDLRGAVPTLDRSARPQCCRNIILPSCDSGARICAI